MTIASDWRDRVFDHIDPADAVGLLTELVRIPSVSGSEAEQDIQEWLAAWLRREGLKVDHWKVPLADLAAEPDFPGMEAPREAAYGLVARLPGTGAGRSLMLNGHVDVVPPGDFATWRAGEPFAGVLIGDDLHGRGACDMKGGLVSALLAIRALRRSGVPLAGDVLLACVVGEEDGGLGTYATLRRGWRADACVITEPTGLDVVPANGGALTFRLRVPGLAAHASRRTEGVSAVERFWPVFQALRGLERQRNTDADPVMSRWDIAYPIEIGTVNAGDWASTVPDLLVAEGRLGVALDEPVTEARAALEQAVATACADDPWLRDHPVAVEWWGGQFAPARLPVDDGGLLELVRGCHWAATGGTADVWGGPYGSDLRLLTGIGGIPTVQYGPGDIALAHAVNESVPVPDVLAAARTLVLVALGHCGLPPDQG
jgi:acetylornithine deacetylase